MIQAYAALAPKAELTDFEYEPGPLAVDEVEIAVMHCGICHSDLSMLDNAWNITQYPLVPGHEVVGKVIAKGKDVANLELSQIVGLGWHAGFCDSCAQCNAGDHNLCSTSQPTIVAHHGGFADKVRAKANSVIPIMSGLDLPAIAPLFCGGITVFNPLLQFNISPTAKVAVIGVGGLGHLALQFYNAWGCEVTAFTSSPKKKDEALKYGAQHTLDSTVAKDIESAAGYFDYIISTVNVKLPWELYLNTLAPKGRLHFVGVTLDPIDISALALIMGQRTISGSPVGSPGNIATMLQFAARHNIKAKIEKYKFSAVNDAMAHLRSGKANYRIVLTAK